jgi:hypothetical protein
MKSLKALEAVASGWIYIAIPGTSTHPDGYVSVVDPRPGRKQNERATKSAAA